MIERERPLEVIVGLHSIHTMVLSEICRTNNGVARLSFRNEEKNPYYQFRAGVLDAHLREYNKDEATFMVPYFDTPDFARLVHVLGQFHDLIAFVAGSPNLDIGMLNSIYILDPAAPPRPRQGKIGRRFAREPWGGSPEVASARLAELEMEHDRLIKRIEAQTRFVSAVTELNRLDREEERDV